MNGKDWWKSTENWVAVVAGGVAFIGYIAGYDIGLDEGTIGWIAAGIMMILRNVKTSEPIKQFNVKR